MYRVGPFYLVIEGDPGFVRQLEERLQPFAVSEGSDLNPVTLSLYKKEGRVSRPSGIQPDLFEQGWRLDSTKQLWNLEFPDVRGKYYRKPRRCELEIHPQAFDRAVPQPIIWLYRLFILLALEEGGVVLHAATIEVLGQALVAVGESGAGKTTLAKMMAAQGYQVLDDEHVLVMPGSERNRLPSVYRLPDREKLVYTGPVGPLPLALVCLLAKAQCNDFFCLSRKQWMPRILSQVFHPSPDARTWDRLFDNLEACLYDTPVGELRFNLGPETVDFIVSVVESLRKKGYTLANDCG